MIFIRVFVISSLLVFLASETAQSQINISTLAEAQYGKLPDESADFFPSLYDRTEIAYRKKGFSIQTTLEQYHTTFEGRSYFYLSQFTLGYKKKRWDVKVGNFYETLGRGLLLRSFEIPGALLEDFGFRSRNYFHRDLLGASVKYRTKKASIKVMHADVLNNLLPPTFDRAARRTDLVTAVETKWKYIKGQEVGVTFMRRQQPSGNSQNYLNGSLSGSLSSGLDYYAEYARNLEESDYAFYSNLTAYAGRFSATIEYKKYRDFVLGAGINEPPAVVKQQTYRVLNRSIHVPNPINEEGYQVDLFYNFENGTVLNLNHSLARNTFGGNTTSFRQFFFEIQSSFGDRFDYKAFVDYSEDPFKGESDRLSFGFYSDIGVTEQFRVLPELECQTFERNENGVYNFNFLLGLNFNSRLFFAPLIEITDDPFIIRDGQSTRIYLGNTVRYKWNSRHTLQFFAGQRRGGPQCSAGVCYEILDFRGVELRWIGKFRIK